MMSCENCWTQGPRRARKFHESAKQEYIAMPAAITNRFLDPAVLGQISGLDLIAKTVVEGFISGLHRSPDFGFSQEFAEYRSYTPGDDLRHVDWNVYARTEKAYLKRYRGETNTTLMVLLDVSASMTFSSGAVSKLDYAKYLASALVYLAHLQRDSAGLIIFHDDVANFIRPSARQGQLMRLLHGIDTAQAGTRTNFRRPFFELQQFLKRRGVTVLISDFFEAPERIIETVEPMRFRGNELILFHVLDARELEPKLGEPALLRDMETGDAIEVSPDYARNEYRQKITEHIQNLEKKAQSAGLDYFLLRTDRPLDAGVARVSHGTEGEAVVGFLSPWFLAGVAAVGLPLYVHLLRKYKSTPQPFSSLMFFERRLHSSVKHRRLRYLALLAMRIALILLIALAFANPFVNRTSAASARRRLTVIAIDRSFSMRESNRMAQAKAEAVRILNAIPGREQVQVIALDSNVENLTQAGPDHALASAAIQAMQPNDRASSFGEFTRALRVLDQSGMRIDAHLISDMQQSSMPPNFRDLQLGPHTLLNYMRLESRRRLIGP